MTKQKTVTATLITIGMFAALGYTAVAQQTQPDTQPSQQTQPDTQPTQQTQPNVQSSPNRLSAADRQFMAKATQGGIAEIRLGQLAAQRAVSDDVKQYGQRMVTDHTNANNQLMQLATQKGVTLPQDTDAQHKAFRARIGQIPGRRFDQTYMNQMVRDHSQTVALFQRQAQRGQDPDVRAFAATNLPIVQEHLQMARAMVNNNTVGK